MSAFILVYFYCLKQTTFWWSITRTWPIPNYMKDKKGNPAQKKAPFNVLMGI